MPLLTAVGGEALDLQYDIPPLLGDVTSVFCKKPFLLIFKDPDP